MADLNPVSSDDPTGERPGGLHSFSPWEAALDAVSHLAVVFALTLALILIVGHQLGHPL
jgi:hypothetical protein